MLLGDKVKQALERVGVSEERVSAFLGRPCRCKERQRKLNQLSIWAGRVIADKMEQAKEYLEGMMGEK
jgi:SOS response regulatory protein OraA/RecX